MRVSRAARLVSALGLSALAALSAFGAAGAARAQAVPPVTPAVATSYTVPGGVLWGVAATSTGNAWAVGDTSKPNGAERPLLLHWNGRTWSRVTVPGVTDGVLNAVTAVSATDAWAVGANYGSGQGLVILHWNGKTWSWVTSASMSNPLLQGESVAATAHDVWVAAYDDSFTTEFLHLTGGRWYVVPTSLPRGYQVCCISVVSSKLAWATGLFQTGDLQSFLLRWNGSVWKRVADPMANVTTNGLASGPGGALWAVGYGPYITSGSVSMRWDGKSWHLVALPSIGGFSGVAFIPGGMAWAVGWNTAIAEYPVIARWTGTTWLQVALLSIANGHLFGVAATSARNAWAVGYSNAGTLIEHWNGKTWS